MLGERIANLRKTKGISQEELADVLLTSRQAISKWERGEASPDIDRLKDLAIYFNVSIDYLLGYDVESNSVNSFIEKCKKCSESGVYDISLEEIRMIYLRNQNNLNLLLAIISYLSDYFGPNKDVAILDAMIEYSQKAIVLYQPNNMLNYSLNDIHHVIVSCYSLKQRYDLGKAYIENNHVYGAEEVLAECEFELGNYEETTKITSRAFLKSISSIITCNLIQIRLFTRTGKPEEALELINWSIDFAKSIGKNEEFFFDLNFILYFFKVNCLKSLKRDYTKELNYLLENRGKVEGFRSDTDALKFYDNQRLSFISGVGSMEESIYEEIQSLEKSGVDVTDALEIYNKVFKGD